MNSWISRSPEFTNIPTASYPPGAENYLFLDFLFTFTWISPYFYDSGFGFWRTYLSLFISMPNTYRLWLHYWQRLPCCLCHLMCKRLKQSLDTESGHNNL